MLNLIRPCLTSFPQALKVAMQSRLDALLPFYRTVNAAAADFALKKGARFGSDPHVIGQKITLNEHDFTVIGVTPPDFASPFAGNAIDVWTPVMMKDYVARPHFSLTDRGSRWLMVMGRLKPGATVSQAQANFSAMARQLEEAYPRTNEQLAV